KTITVAISNDTVFEGAENFQVNLSAPNNATLGTASVTTTIHDDGTGTGGNDNDTPTLSVSNVTVAESGGFAQFTVGLSNTSTSATSFSLGLAGGNAIGSGTDYGSLAASNLQVSTDGGTTWNNATSGTIAAGSTSVLVRTPITDDLINEANETFQLTATRTGGFTTNNSAVGTATITDNDLAPSLTINDVIVNEAAGTATFTVTLSAASGQTVTVGYNTSNGSATAGADYTSASGSVSFLPGVTTQTITVNITNDSVFELSENFNVNLVAPVNAIISDAQGLGTIKDDGTGPGGNDNDTPSLNVSNVTVAEDGGFAQFTVSLSNASNTPTSVNLALAGGNASGSGADYGSLGANNLQVSIDGGNTWSNASTATIAAGSTSVLVRTPITDDLIDEANETFQLTAIRTSGTTTNSSAVGTATIIDNEGAPSISINNVVVNEDAGVMTFTVRLSHATTDVVTFNYVTGSSGINSATAGSDYVASLPGASGSIAAGLTTTTITVPINDDYIKEGNETFNVTLSGLSINIATVGNTLVGLGTITDAGSTLTPPDVPEVIGLVDTVYAHISVDAASVAEGGVLTYTVTLKDSSGNVVSVPVGSSV
ncbi:Calx-beta domain-containing protein, partial [Undibacterium sp. Ji22W]|uniref:Calx-beta domain-containing protein n=1 Tax=Undibacterium sp. Ji22W TaxID=3413038 RepID=UPI003BF2EFA0